MYIVIESLREGEVRMENGGLTFWRGNDYKER